MDERTHRPHTNPIHCERFRLLYTAQIVLRHLMLETQNGYNNKKDSSLIKCFSSVHRSPPMYLSLMLPLVTLSLILFLHFTTNQNAHWACTLWYSGMGDGGLPSPSNIHGIMQLMSLCCAMALAAKNDFKKKWVAQHTPHTYNNQKILHP